MTPYSLATSVMGIIGGLLLARFGRYRWIMIVSYGLLTVSMFWMSRFNHDTSTMVVILASGLAGMGLGSLPTVNTLVVQNATPTRMLGQVTGANLFFVMIGMAMAPAILGSTMNSAYAQALPVNLAAAASQVLDAPTLGALSDPRVLLSPAAMDALRDAFAATSSQSQELFQQTMFAARSSMEGALSSLFLLGAIVMIASLLLMATIPEIPLGETNTSAPAESKATEEPLPAAHIG